MWRRGTRRRRRNLAAEGDDLPPDKCGCALGPGPGHVSDRYVDVNKTIHTPRLFNFRITVPCRAGMSSTKPHFALTPTNAYGIAAQHKTPQAGKQTPPMSARAVDNGKSSITPPPFLAEAPHPPEVALEIFVTVFDTVFDTAVIARKVELYVFAP